MIAQLDTKTVYSFMESMVSIKRYVSLGKEYGYYTILKIETQFLYKDQDKNHSQ